MVEYLNPRATKIIGGENFTQKKILMKELLKIINILENTMKTLNLHINVKKIKPLALEVKTT